MVRFFILHAWSYRSNWVQPVVSPIFHKAVANGPVSQVLAGGGPLFLKVMQVQDKNKIPNPLYKKPVINKSTRVIYGLVQLVIL